MKSVQTTDGDRITMFLSDGTPIRIGPRVKGRKTVERLKPSQIKKLPRAIPAHF